MIPKINGIASSIKPNQEGAPEIMDRNSIIIAVEIQKLFILILKTLSITISHVGVINYFIIALILFRIPILCKIPLIFSTR